MRRNIIFITGGARSGKSSFGLKLAEDRLKALGLKEKNNSLEETSIFSLQPKKAYIATAQAFDEEMKDRIEKHRQQRGNDWHTVEEPFDIVGALNKLKEYPVILLDCLTLWISNLMLNNIDIQREIEQFLNTINSSAFSFQPSALIIISNEVGMGIVPENELARRFRDIAGMFNQKVAENSDEVYFVVSGMPIKIKG
jgi:adenosylcobinamide kinase/adenosylcobinamide-phosphate guanylyltransferase